MVIKRRIQRRAQMLWAPRRNAAASAAVVQKVNILGTVTDGVTPISGVTVTFGAYSAVSGADGTYTIADVPESTTATLTPTKTNYLFNPATIGPLTTSSVTGNITGQDFTPFLPLLYDTFTTSASAPLTSPRTAEPGPGTMVFTDAANIISIANGALVINGTSSGTNTGFIGNDATARAAGRAFTFNMKSLVAAGLNRSGAGTALTSGTITHRIDFQPTAVSIATVVSRSWTPPATYTFVERANGAFYVNGSKLIYVTNVGNTAAKPLMWIAGGQAPNMQLDSIHVLDLVSMNTDAKIYTSYTASPSTGVTAAMDADAILDFIWTPAANETLTFLFRRTDDNNTLKLVCDQAAGTIKLYKRIASTDTELTGGTTTQTWTAAAARHILIITDGTDIKTFVDDVPKNAPAAQTAQQSATTYKVSGFATGANLYAWKTNLTALMPNFLIPSIPAKYYLVAGDSKSVNNVWETTFESLVNTPEGKYQWVDTIATVGWSVRVVQQAIDARLAALAASPAPEFCIINLGTNDVNGDSSDIGDGTTWTTNYQYIIDAIHTKWASCQVYVTRPWKPGAGFAAKFTLMNGTCIPNVISGRAWAHLGPNESVYLENGDNGATYIQADQIHPTTAGYALTAAQNKTAVGL